MIASTTPSPDGRCAAEPLDEVVDGQDQDAVDPVLACHQPLGRLDLAGWEDLRPCRDRLSGEAAAPLHGATVTSGLRRIRLTFAECASVMASNRSPSTTNHSGVATGVPSRLKLTRLTYLPGIRADSGGAARSIVWVVHRRLLS